MQLFFNEIIRNLRYLPTEPNKELHSSIISWCVGTDVLAPLSLDVNSFQSDAVFPQEFRNRNVDVLICINMIHISPSKSTENLFNMAQQIIKPGGIVLTYGPYIENGFMVESNVKFNDYLKSQSLDWGIRHIEDVKKIAEASNFILESRHEMPANNLTLIFKNIEE